MSQYIRIGTVWKEIDGPSESVCSYVKVGGEWKSVYNVYVNIGGTWRSVCEKTPPPTTTTTTTTAGPTTTTTTAAPCNGPSPTISNVTVTNVGQTSAVINFNASGMWSYQIYSGNYNSGTINSTATTVNHTASGLTCATNYQLTIVAWATPNGVQNQPPGSNCQTVTGVPSFNTTACTTTETTPTPTPAPEICGPCEAYSFTQPVCNGEDSYVGNFTGYRKTCTIGGVFSRYDTSGCPGSTFNGFGACLATNVSSCGGSGGAGGPCGGTTTTTTTSGTTTTTSGTTTTTTTTTTSAPLQNYYWCCCSNATTYSYPFASSGEASAFANQLCDGQGTGLCSGPSTTFVDCASGPV